MLNAQDKESNAFSISAQADYGFLVGHHAEMQRLSTRHFPSFRIYLAHQTSGKKLWHRYYNYPEVGIGVYFSPLTYSEELGHAVSVFAYFDRPLGNNGWKTFRIRFGFGPGYLSSKFDAKTNNQNIAIGTHWNIFLLFELQKEFRLSKNLDLRAGLGIAHFSNTSIQLPNLGLNLPSVQLALKYKIGRQDINDEEIPEPIYKVWTHEITASVGRRQSEIINAKAHVLNLRYLAIYSLTFKSALAASADLFLNKAEEFKYEYQYIDDSFQAGIAAGYVLNLEQFQFMLQWGAYLYNKNPDFAWYYHRVGFKWIASEHLLLNVSLRTEWARARNLEFGLGWRF
jgi:hypothetical protein